MAFLVKSALKKLEKAIQHKKDQCVIKDYEQKLSYNIKELSKINSFYSLPISAIADILQNVDFSKVENPASLIKSIFENASIQHKDDSALLLHAIKCSNVTLSLYDCVNILQSINTCDLCVQLGQLYAQIDSFINRDFDYELIQRGEDIQKLRRRIPRDPNGVRKGQQALKAATGVSYSKSQQYVAPDLKALFHNIADVGDDGIPEPPEFKPITKEPPLFEPDIFKAIAKEKLFSVQYILEQTNTSKECKDWDGNTPLHIACQYGCITIVQYLIEVQNVNKESKNNDGKAAIHIAALSGHLPIVRYLIERQHVNKESLDSDKWTPLHYACWKGHLPIVSYLIEKQHANKEAVDKDGYTPLHWACEKGHIQNVEYLIEQQKVNINAQNKSGQTPLMIASYYGHTDIVKYLLACGADRNIKTNIGHTALNVAGNWNVDSSRKRAEIRELIRENH